MPVEAVRPVEADESRCCIRALQRRAASLTRSLGQCDGCRPTCSRCAKAKRECLGYRDELDIVFRDQTQAIEKRFKVPDANSVVFNCIIPEARSHPSPKRSLPYSLSQDTEQLALSFFFHKSISIPRQSEAAPGVLELLPSLFASTKPTSALSSATTALSFVAFATDPARKAFLPQARSKYGEAMVRVQDALQDPVAVRKDETLMTILLLRMLEVSLFVERRLL